MVAFLAEGSADGSIGASGRARLAVLASGSGSNLGAILTACSDGALNADVVLVAGDQPNAAAFDRARAAGVPATTVLQVPVDKSQRRAWAAELAERVLAHEPDWVILAGFMRILPSEFLDRFPNRVVNLHPALPGEFPGTRAIERALIEAKDGLRSSTGIMVHFVPNEGVDDGPVLATCVIPIDGRTSGIAPCTIWAHGHSEKLALIWLMSVA